MRALIIFYKNPIAGKVKTRLAARIGVQAALRVYQMLAAHTATVAAHVNASRFIYYSDAVEYTEPWTSPGFERFVQKGSDLGQRMQRAFEEVFEKGFKEVLIIGTDCKTINAAIIEDAFRSLSQCDVVLGPAEDGGYYLMGMNQLHKDLFGNKAWSTSTVLSSTLQDCNNLRLNVHLLPTLRDVDEFEDLDDDLLRLEQGKIT